MVDEMVELLVVRKVVVMDVKMVVDLVDPMDCCEVLW